MTSDQVWFEVDKSNGAILSYFTKVPINPSDEYDYIEGTEDELVYLSALEDEVFPPGMVATLSDLTDHRARLQAAKKTSPDKAQQRPSEAVKQPGKATPQTEPTSAGASLIAALKQHRKHKKGN